MRYLTFFIMSFVIGVSGVNAIAFPLTISEDFTGDGRVDFLSYERVDGGISVDYSDSKSGRRLHYIQKNFDLCNSLAIYVVPKTKKIAIDGSCQSQGGQVYVRIYEWSGDKSDWCLIREITGEKPDVLSRDFVGSRHVSRVLGCPRIGDDGPYSYVEPKDVRSVVNKEIYKLSKVSRVSSGLNGYILSMPFYDPLEISENLTKENVDGANNLAFYFSLNGRSGDVLQLLRAIVSEFPERVVAKLNLADAYWDNNMKESSREMYSKYVSQMRRIGASGLIPSRAISRM